MPSLRTSLAILILPLAARAITPEEAEFFETKIRPVLVEQCYKCHGPDKQKGDLRLDSRAAVLKGSDVGLVAVPGKPEESSLITSIRHQGDSKMPEKADKLPADQIADRAGDALIWNMDELYARECIKHLTGEVRRAAVSGRPEK